MNKVIVTILTFCIALIMLVGVHTFAMGMNQMDASCAHAGVLCTADAGMSFDCLAHCLKSTSSVLPSAPTPILVLLGTLVALFFVAVIAIPARVRKTQFSDWIGLFLRHRFLVGVRLLN